MNREIAAISLQVTKPRILRGHYGRILRVGNKIRRKQDYVNRKSLCSINSCNNRSCMRRTCTYIYICTYTHLSYQQIRVFSHNWFVINIFIVTRRSGNEAYCTNGESSQESFSSAHKYLILI